VLLPTEFLDIVVRHPMSLHLYIRIAVQAGGFPLWAIVPESPQVCPVFVVFKFSLEEDECSAVITTQDYFWQLSFYLHS
jgi:hypothetical protein